MWLTKWGRENENKKFFSYYFISFNYFLFKQNSKSSLKKIEIPKTNEVVEVPTEVITKNNTKKVPENMFNGILDKVKSKITGKPLTQV